MWPPFPNAQQRPAFPTPNNARRSQRPTTPGVPNVQQRPAFPTPNNARRSQRPTVVTAIPFIVVHGLVSSPRARSLHILEGPTLKVSVIEASSRAAPISGEKSSSMKRQDWSRRFGQSSSNPSLHRLLRRCWKARPMPSEVRRALHL
jgi:hypothetical protein